MTSLTWLEAGPVAVIARATAIVLVALVLHRMLRSESALSRHALWSTVMIALLALPLLHVRLPTLAVPGWRTTADVTLRQVAPPAVVTPTVEPERLAPVRGGSVAFEAPVSEAPAPVTRAIPWTVIVTLCWLVGAVALLVPVAVGTRRARRLADVAFPVQHRRLLARLAYLQRVTGVRRAVSLRVSEAVRTPMAWGFRHPIILLPLDAIDWTPECLDAVLVHELVHIRHADPIHQCLARVASATYWFHPLVWRGAYLAADARERACDDAVLRFGTRPSHYARHLVALAEHRTTAPSMPALARLHHPNLEDRIMTILHQSPVRRSPWRTALAVGTVAAWTLAVAAAGPATAQVPAPPAPPALARTAPTPPTPPSAPVVVPAALAPPNAPAAPPPPPPPPPRADCARGPNNGLVVSSRASGEGPNRVIHRNLDDGRTICLAVRGALPEEFVLAPLGRLPVGIVLTLEATTRGGGVQRMEITGAATGNQHRWLVNGAERPVDAEAREWRDAMLEVLSLGLKASRVRTAAAIEQSRVMRAQAERMASEARALSAVQARDIREQAVLVSEQAQAVRAQRADIEAAAERVHAQAVRLEAERPSEVDARRVRAMHERAVIQERRVREQEAAVAEVAERVRRSSVEMRATERAMADRARVIQDRSERLAEVTSRRAVEAAARVREVESPRLREIDAELAPRERRLMELIDRVEPRR